MRWFCDGIVCSSMMKDRWVVVVYWCQECACLVWLWCLSYIMHSTCGVFMLKDISTMVLTLWSSDLVRMYVHMCDSSMRLEEYDWRHLGVEILHRNPKTSTSNNSTGPLPYTGSPIERGDVGIASHFNIHSGLSITQSQRTLQQQLPLFQQHHELSNQQEQRPRYVQALQHVGTGPKTRVSIPNLFYLAYNSVCLCFVTN